MGWLTGWQYRRPVTIDNTNNSNDLTDYQVLVVVDTASLIQQGKMQVDGDDIRFTDSDGTTLLPYWIEGPINDANTKIWVKVSSIPAQGTKVIYFYYGNPSASSESSIADTFIREIDGAQVVKASWHIDEGSGNTIYDRSGGNHNGIIYGASWTNTSRFGKALYFDGVDDYVEVPYHSDLNPQSFSVEAWARVTGNQGKYRSVITSRKGVIGEPYLGYIIYAGSDNNWQFWTGTGQTAWNKIINGAISLNTWTHLVGTCGGGVMKFYVNNVVYTLSISSFAVNNVHPLRIGAGTTEGSPQFFFCGQIDEVRVYSRVLTAEEVSDLYNYYGYTTPNYAGRVLVRKRIDLEPMTSVGAEETSEVPIIIAQRRLLIIGI